jgi:hypothetical protein
MFPNVRLMMAATLASVVALICGFGVFAVFRVSHEPFARSPAATASLQLVADNTGYSSAGFASSAPFDRHLPVGTEPSAAAAPDMPVPIGGHQAETEAAPASESVAATPEQASSETGEATEQPAAAATPTDAVPAAGANVVSANDAADIAAPSRSEAKPATTAAAAEEVAPSPDTMAVASDQETKSAVASVADAGAAFSAAAVAVNEQHDARPPSSGRVTPSSAPSDAAGPSGETALKKPKRIRATARIRRLQPVAATQYAPSQFVQSQYTSATEQNWGATQTNYQTTARSQAQYFATPAPVRYVRVVARKPKAPNKEPNTATGGPFVSVTNR